MAVIRKGKVAAPKRMTLTSHSQSLQQVKRTIGEMEKNYVKPEMEFVHLNAGELMQGISFPLSSAKENPDETIFDAKERDESEEEEALYEQTNSLWD